MAHTGTNTILIDIKYIQAQTQTYRHPAYRHRFNTHGKQKRNM